MSHATTAEILQAFRALTPADMRGLHKFAQRKLSGIYTEPSDLIHEALDRSLEGKRNWPTHIPFTLYMVQTIKSIVSHDLERIENKSSRMRSIEPGAEPASSLPSPEEQVMVFQQLELARKTAERAKQELAGDPNAIAVIDGMLAGLSPREACDHFGMNAKDYDAARQRAVRRLRMATH